MDKHRIRPGGLYIADNVLRHGRVALKHCQDVVRCSTEAIVEHNRLVSSDPGFDTFINPIRDGVIVARKKMILAILKKMVTSCLDLPAVYSHGSLMDKLV